MGKGKGTSVLEMVAGFEMASGKKIPLVMSDRRPGDAEVVYTSTKKAARVLNWKASKNPYGYLTKKEEKQKYK